MRLDIFWLDPRLGAGYLIPASVPYIIGMECPLARGGQVPAMVASPCDLPHGRGFLSRPRAETTTGGGAWKEDAMSLFPARTRRADRAFRAQDA